MIPYLNVLQFFLLGMCGWRFIEVSRPSFITTGIGRAWYTRANSSAKDVHSVRIRLHFGNISLHLVLSYVSSSTAEWFDVWNSLLFSSVVDTPRIDTFKYRFRSRSPDHWKDLPPKPHPFMIASVKCIRIVFFGSIERESKVSKLVNF